MSSRAERALITLLIGLVGAVFEKLLRRPMNIDAKHFFTQLSYVTVGTLIATFFSFTFTILGGRLIGPDGYGTFGLIQSIAMFLYLPMVLGINTAMVRSVSESTDLNEQRRILSTTYILTACFIAGSVVLYVLSAPFLADVLNISREGFFLAVLFAVLFVLHSMTTNTLRALHRMRDFSVMKIAGAVVLLSSFLILVAADTASYRSMVIAMYASFGFVAIYILLRTGRTYLRPVFDGAWARTGFRYGAITLLSAVSFILYSNIDRLLINQAMSVADVGIYGAYYYGTINMVGILSGIFITVFFPAAARYRDKEKLFKTVNRFIPPVIALGLPLTFAAGSVILLLYGGAYPFDLWLMALFAVTAVLVGWYGVYAWLFNSEGAVGAAVTLSGTGSIAVSNIVLNLALIPPFGLYGAISATALAYCIGMAIILMRRKTVFAGNGVRERAI